MSASSDVHRAEQHQDPEPLRNDQLQRHEIFWRDKQGFLEENGYMLRQRFRPGWIPSWLSSDLPPTFHEDSWPLVVSLALHRQCTRGLTNWASFGLT